MRKMLIAVTVPLLVLAAAAPGTLAAKKRKAPKGPSVAFVKKTITQSLKTTHTPTGGTAAQVEVRFEAPVKVLKARKVNPNKAGNVNDAGGRINVWPARTNVTIIVHKDDTPADDTYCDGTWVNSQWIFYRTAKGNWAFYGDSIDFKKGLPDRYGPNAPCVR